jgi:hypothetical protein
VGGGPEILFRAIVENVDRESHLMTDELHGSRGVGTMMKGRGVIKHSIGEYVRENAHTNTVEGFFGLLKRGINGVYHHGSRGHLQRYCDEFSFRYENRKVSDGTRANLLVQGAEGKRLTYKQPAGTSAGEREHWKREWGPQPPSFWKL